MKHWRLWSRMLIATCCMMNMLTLTTWGQDRPIRIGVLVSDPHSLIGEAQIRTIDMLSNQIGDISGRRVDIEIEDAGRDEGQVISALNLLFEKRVDAIIGPGLESQNRAIMKYPTTWSSANDRTKIPMILWATELDVKIPTDPWVFQISLSYSMAIEKIFEHMQHQEIKAVTLYGTDAPWSQEILNFLEKKSQNMFFSIENVLTYSNSTPQDFVDSYPPQPQESPHRSAILHYGRFDKSFSMIESLLEGREDALYLLYPGIWRLNATPQFPAKGRVYVVAPNFLVTDMLKDAEQKKRLLEFASSYRQQYNNHPVSDIDIATHDALMLLIAAFRQLPPSGIGDNEALRKALEGMHEFRGLSMTFSFSHYGVITNSYIVFQVYGSGCINDHVICPPCNECALPGYCDFICD